LRDIQYRAVRLLFVVLGISVVFTLLLLMTGLTEQFKRESKRTFDAFGATAWVLPEGATGPFTSVIPVDAAAAAQVTASGGAAPVVVSRDSMQRPGHDGVTDVLTIGVGLDGLGGPTLVQGSLPAAAGEVVIDKSAKVGLGDEVRLGADAYKVVGLSKGRTLFAGIPLVFMSVADAQQHVYRGLPLVSAVLTVGDVQAPDGLRAVPSADVVKDTKRPLKNAVSSIDLVRVLLWGVATLIIGTMVYLTALERRRDFAVMKAVGAPTRTLLIGLAVQSALIALVASGLASVFQIFVVPSFPLDVIIDRAALIQLPIVAVVVALVASLAGMRKVVKADPAMAFAGPGA
jgi:putative ABC transport system permease protein